MAGGQATDQHIFNERVGGKFGEFGVKMQHEQGIDAQFFDLPGLDAKRGQAKRLAIGFENFPRVRLERQYRPRNTRIMGDSPGFANDRLMAQVNTIEITDGNGRSFYVGWQVFVMSKNLHRQGNIRYPSRDGTMTVASPSITVLSPTMHMVFNSTNFLSGINLVTVIRAVTVSPDLTGALNRTDWLT